MKTEASSYQDIYRSMDSGIIDAALVIPPDFSKRQLQGLPANVQTLIDGSFPSTAVMAINYAKAINEIKSSRGVNRFLQNRGMPEIEEAVIMEPRVWYNPSLKSKNFIVPGLFAVILMAFPPLLSALAVVREKERGSIQQVMVSPIKPYEFIIGKLIPYGGIAFAEVLLILVVGVFWFHIPVRGSILLFLALSVMYVMCTVGIGLLTSTVTKSQVAAMLLALVITVMPSKLAEGLTGKVQLIADGSNSLIATTALGYAAQVIGNHSVEVEMERLGVDPGIFETLPVIRNSINVLYDPELKFTHFNLLAIAALFRGVLLAAGAIVREKEAGTLEQLLVTPITSGN